MRTANVAQLRSVKILIREIRKNEKPANHKHYTVYFWIPIFYIYGGQELLLKYTSLLRMIGLM